VEKYIPKPGDTIVNGRRMLVIESNNGLCFVVPYQKSYFTGKWERCVPIGMERIQISAFEVSALVNRMGWKVL